MPISSELKQKIGCDESTIDDDSLSVFLSKIEWNLSDLSELGLELINQSRFDLAGKIFARWTDVTPTNPEPWTNLGLCLVRQRKIHDARDVLEYALEINPDYLPALNNLGEVYQELGEHDLQLKNCLTAVNKNPTSSLGFNNLGAAFVDMGMFDEARHAFETSLLLDSSSFEARFNLAKLASREGEHQFAAFSLETLKKTIVLENSREADLIGLYLGIEYLICGRLKEGWELYEKGFSSHIPPSLARNPNREFAVPAWEGQVLAADERLMIWREQGVGDELRFSALIPLLCPSIRSNLIFECDERLINLFSGSMPGVKIRSEKDSSNDFSYHLPVGSLPKFLMHSPDVLRRARQFLFPNSSHVEEFSRRLANFKDKKLIGICWRSHVLSAKRNRKYTALDDWDGILSLPDTVFVNLQYGDCEHEIREAEKKLGIRIVRWDDVDLKNDFDRTAALIKNLDLVISVSTSVVPLAGAVGVSTICLTYQNWVLLGQKNYYPWFPPVLPIIVPNSESMATALPDIRELLIQDLG